MKRYLKNLPDHLIERYKNWKKNGYEENKSWYEKIASEGQRPSSMIISCCDSRIHVTSIFGADLGEFFIHRNIANLIPPYNPDGDHHGTSAAVEYAVKTLRVSNIIILGHSHCGGIENGYHLCKGNRNLEDTIFINKWLKILQPAFNKVISSNNKFSDSQGINKLEKESIITSLENLTEFPFVNNSLKTQKLSLHGLWHEIRTGSIEFLDPVSLKFKKV